MNSTVQQATPLKGYSTLNKGWRMTLEDGEPVRFENPRFGVLEIGMHPGGAFDQWLFHENGGGGVMAVGYVRKDGDIYVMMLIANRFNLVGGTDDIEVPGGFFDGNEPALTGAIREAMEETGILMPELEETSGRNYTGNRAFFVLDGENEGTKVFNFELTAEQAELVEADPRLVLVPWRLAVRKTRDALSGMAIARVLTDVL